MRKDFFAGLIICESVRSVRLEFDMFPMLKYTNEEYVEK